MASHPGARKQVQANPSVVQAHDGGPVEAAQFLSAGLIDFILMARRHRLDTLSYLLDMAKLEADEIVRQQGRHKGF